MASASAIFDKDAVGGENVVDDIILAFQFAENDPYRAVTHNKGVMNGTIAVANATGQDSRAIEAAAHAYAAKSGSYRSLTKWSKDANGNLVGDFELPLICWYSWWSYSTSPNCKNLYKDTWSFYR